MKDIIVTNSTGISRRIDGIVIPAKTTKVVGEYSPRFDAFINKCRRRNLNVVIAEVAEASAEADVKLTVDQDDNCELTLTETADKEAADADSAPEALNDAENDGESKGAEGELFEGNNDTTSNAEPVAELKNESAADIKPDTDTAKEAKSEKKSSNKQTKSNKEKSASEKA